jgi:hypothetical protein
MALSKNSSFYLQSGPYYPMSNAELFQEELYAQLFEKPKNESGCFIPKSIKEEIPDFETRTKAMIKDIHNHLFNGKADLTLEERKLFIEIYYDTLTKFIIKGIGADSFNITCKNAVDRGAASNAQLFASCAIVQDPAGTIPSHQQTKMELLMMARAFVARNRAPYQERVESLSKMLDFTLSRPECLKKLHQSVFGTLLIEAV